MLITNNSRALQGVHSTSGLVFIEAGKSQEIDVDPDYLDRLKSLPFLKIGDKADEPADAIIDGRNADGDTPEMAQLRGMFNASWQALSKDHEKAAADLAAANGDISTLNDRVTELQGQITAKDAEIAALKKASTGDTGNAVTSVAEALALFSTDGVHVNTAKAKAKAFLGDKVKADASKDDILKALLTDASDTEVKTFLGAKGVEVKDETRDDLIKLALAA